MLIALADAPRQPLGDSASVRFSHNVRRRRQVLGMTQAELAEKIKAQGGRLFQQTIAKIESRTRGVTLDDAEALARALDVTVAHLLDGPIVSAGQDDLSRLSDEVNELLMQVARASDASRDAQRARAAAQQQEDAAHAFHVEVTERYREAAIRLLDAYDAALARGETSPIMRIVEQQMETWDKQGIRKIKDQEKKKEEED